MSPPLVILYTTSLPLPAKQRTEQEYLIRTLSTLSIPFVKLDVSLDEDAKRIWRRKGRTDGKLPGFLVGGEFVGTLEDFEYAVEDARLPSFLRQDTEASSPSSPTAATLSSSLAADTTSTSTTAHDPANPTSAEAKEGSRRTAEEREDDRLLAAAGEDELEKLLREMEGENGLRS